MVAGVLTASANAEAGCPAFLPVWVSSEVFYACYQQMSWLTFELVFYSISLHSLNKMYCLTLREHFENHHHQSHLEYSQRSLGSPPCPHCFCFWLSSFCGQSLHSKIQGFCSCRTPPPTKVHDIHASISCSVDQSQIWGYLCSRCYNSVLSLTNNEFTITKQISIKAYVVQVD